MGGVSRGVALPAAAGKWRAAVSYCPYCSADGCERCGQSGDLMGWLLECAYRQGREDALVSMREVFKVARLAGVQVRDMPVPELKRKLGL